MIKPRLVKTQSELLGHSEHAMGKLEIDDKSEHPAVLAQRKTVTTLLNRLMNRMVLLDKVLLTKDADMVKVESANLDHLMSDLVDASGRLTDVLDDIDCATQTKIMEKMDNEVFALKEKVYAWLTEHSKEERDSHQHPKSRSSRSSSYKSSRRSNKSSSSSSKSRKPRPPA